MAIIVWLVVQQTSPSLDAMVGMGWDTLCDAFVLLWLPFGKFEAPSRQTKHKVQRGIDLDLYRLVRASFVLGASRGTCDLPSESSAL